MLSLIKLADAEYPLAQVALGIEDYYLGVGEAPGVWAGRWAAELELAGVVEAGELRALVNGVDPRDGAWWLEGRPTRKVNAFDATFSAPKSASLLWAFGSPETASIVSRAHVEAVSEALAFLEGKAALSRQQSDRVRTRVETHGLAVATFVHRTSRAGDPQLHTHCIVPNVVCRADGSYATLDGAVLYEWAKPAGCVYQEQLRRVLTAELGVAWGPDRNGCREMVGFAPDQLRVFSKRSSEIEACLEKSGGVYRTAAARMRADHEASLATRSPKNHDFTPERLKDRWAEEAAAVGLAAPAEVEALVVNGGGHLAPLTWDEVVEALVDSETGLCANNSRFGEAHVVERVAALGAGRLAVDDIERLSRRFLASEHVVRLTPDLDAARRTAPEWTSTAHLALEKRVLGRLDELVSRSAAALDPVAVDLAIEAEAPGLGADQADAVRSLCGSGPALRTLIAPAGFGKTTSVHAAASAAVACGYPVIGVATTNRAVAELRDVGVPSMTIARLAIDLAGQPLAPGTVVILDEASQTATADAEVVLAAVLAAPGGQLWCLGDVRQAQAVRAGGLAAELDRLDHGGFIPAPALTENRRQHHPAERAALAAYRSGDLEASQTLRADAGLEHEHATPLATREAMADAVAADIAAHGSNAVVALAVSHADCEDLADRTRARLAAAGKLTGAALEGPGWSGQPRSYQAGDRVLLHTRAGTGSGRMHNGTTVTVVAATADGLTVATDAGQAALLPAAFVTGRRADGRPNVSHGWCRTVDGAQGGTWDYVHLLGSAALDNFTGYVGQSRASTVTHTWNVRRLPEGDWGGRLADDRSAADQVLDAVGRAPLKTFAAHDDPYLLDRELSAEIAAHHAVLADLPPDLSAQLAHAVDEHARSERAVASWTHQIDYDLFQASRVGPIAGLRRDRRRERDISVAAAERHHGELHTAEHAVARWNAEVARLTALQQARAAFVEREGWRANRIDELQGRLDRHWGAAVLAVTQQGDPLAFGVDRLRAAHQHYTMALGRLNASLPPDRADELTRAERDLAHHRANHTHAQREMARAAARLEAAGTRRFGMRDKPAIAAATSALDRARRVVEQTDQLMVNTAATVEAERTAVAVRAQVEQAVAGERSALLHGKRATDDALDATRPARVLDAATDPLGGHLGRLLGTPPPDRASRAAWCGLAQRIETVLDDPAERARLEWSRQPTDILVRGLLSDGPHAAAHARDAISGATGLQIEAVALNDPSVWEECLRIGTEATHPARLVGRHLDGPELGL